MQQSRYSAEIPSEYLQNSQGQYINEKGVPISDENKVRNNYYREYLRIWEEWFFK